MPTSLNFFKPDRFLLEDDEYEKALPTESGMPTQAPELPSMGAPTQEPPGTASSATRRRNTPAAP